MPELISIEEAGRIGSPGKPWGNLPVFLPISLESTTFHALLIYCMAVTCCEGSDGERGDAYNVFYPEDMMRMNLWYYNN